MDGSNCSCSNLNSPYYDRRCKNKMMLLETNIDSLSDDVVFNILVRMPAQDIYNVVRLVCRKWYQIINSPNFIYSHLARHSTCGLLIQNRPTRNSPPTFVELRKGRIEISNSSYPEMGFILSSCDGLVLERRGRESYYLYITNPLTKRRIALPQKFQEWAARINSIAYAPTSMVYKAVHIFYDSDSKSTCCAMVTVGVDKSWRRIVISQHLSEKAKGLVRCKSLTIGGFVIWAENTNVLACDVETEIITQIHVPQFHGERLWYYYLSAGSYLSLLVGRTEFSWEVWEMKPETGEWTKLPNIEFGAQKGTFEQICLKRNKSMNFSPTPVGLLKYPEVLVFDVCVKLGFKVPSEKGLCIVYNIHTQEIESFDISWCSNFFVHRNTLVSLNGCEV